MDVRLEILHKMRNLASCHKMWTSLCALMTSGELVEACRAPKPLTEIVVAETLNSSFARKRGGSACSALAARNTVGEPPWTPGGHRS